MHRRLLLRAAKNPFQPADVRETIQQNLIATNVGNLLFSDASFRMLSTAGTEVVTNGPRLNGDAADPGRINEEYDAFVIPLANAFRPDFRRHLRTLAGLVERLRIPVTVLGVGGQANLDYVMTDDDSLDRDVKRFVSAVLDHGPSIGVRGEFTAAYLDRLGFSEVEVIGCPSMFLHGADLAIRPREQLSRASRLAVSLSPHVDEWAGLLRRAYVDHPEMTYVPQDLVDLELLFWGDLSRADGASDEDPMTLAYPLLRDERALFPLDPSTWITALRGFDFMLGTRIHGGVAALLAGTPAVVVCHDSRTLELCDYFEIPHVRATEIGPEVDVRALYESADFSAMTGGHSERLTRMTDYLASHGLPTVFDPGGDRGAAFDARIAATSFEAPLPVWDGHDDGHLGFRVAALRAADARISERIAVQARKNSALAHRVDDHDAAAAEVQKTSKRVASLEAQFAAAQAALAEIKADIASLTVEVRTPLTVRIRRSVRARIRRVFARSN